MPDDLQLHDWFHLRLLALRTCKSSVVIPEKKTSFGNDIFQSSDEKVSVGRGGGGGADNCRGVSDSYWSIAIVCPVTELASSYLTKLSGYFLTVWPSGM
jgi:hypothetical protein